MTIKAFIDESLRPQLGDGNANIPLSTGNNQSYKYPEEYLIDLLNECVMDIASTTKFFARDGYAILKAGDTGLQLPKDFKGFLGTSDMSSGQAVDANAKAQDIHIIPDAYGVRFAEPITQEDIRAFGQSTAGVQMPNEILDGLARAGIITDVNNILVLVGTEAIVSYKYLYVPDEFEPTTEIAGIKNERELRYMLRWGVASMALFGNLHSESMNLAQTYYKIYTNRKEKAGILEHDWNNVSLSPYPLGG